MTYRFYTTTLAAVFTAGAALAQTPPAPPAKGQPDKAEMQRHAAEMCRDRLAQATGHMAYLEAKLNLTAQQKPLFERWKKIKLGAAQAAECLPPPGSKPSIIEHMKGEEKMLRQRLDELKAEMPALEALFVSLSGEQKKAFMPPPRHPGEGPGMKHHGPMGPGAGPHGGPPHDGPQQQSPDRDGPPPPPRD